MSSPDAPGSVQEATGKPNDPIKAAAEMIERVSDGSDMTNTTSGAALDSADNIGTPPNLTDVARGTDRETDVDRGTGKDTSPMSGAGISGGVTTATDMASQALNSASDKLREATDSDRRDE